MQFTNTDASLDAAWVARMDSQWSTLLDAYSKGVPCAYVHDSTRDLPSMKNYDESYLQSYNLRNSFNMFAHKRRRKTPKVIGYDRLLDMQTNKKRKF